MIWEIEMYDPNTNSVVQSIIESDATRRQIIKSVKKGGMRPLRVKPMSGREAIAAEEMYRFGRKRRAVANAIYGRAEKSIPQSVWLKPMLALAILCAVVAVLLAFL